MCIRDRVYIDPSGAEGLTNMIIMIIGILIACVFSFVATYATYKDCLLYTSHWHILS